MLTVVIPNTDEPTVIQLTYDNLRKELQSVGGSEILVTGSWEAGIHNANGEYICLVEPDCLVSSSYFSSNVNLFKKQAYYRKLAMVSSCLGIDDWSNRIYGYKLDTVTAGDEKLSTSYRRIAPERRKKGTGLYPVQVGFVPGAIIRKSVLKDLVTKFNFRAPGDLVEFSTAISFHLWDTNRRIVINPNTTYVSTDRTLENPAEFDPKVPNKAANIFNHEQF